MLPKAINYNNVIFNKIGMIKMNDGAFLVAVNNNKLINFSFTQIPGLITGLKFEVKNPTQVEYDFMNFIQNKIQDKIDNGEFSNINEIDVAFKDINKYINTAPGLLNILKQLPGNDFEEYFIKLMSNNKYFKEEENQKKLEEYPQYDENAVTMILTSQQPNLDVDKFVNEYFNDFNIEQIDLLLTNYNLDENKIKSLNERKNILNENISSQERNKKNTRAKTKVFALPHIKESKEAAFIDTLLLSFTVGILCGIYLTYFILTIMS